MRPKLLIVDDDKEMRDWLRLVFRRLDAVIVDARDGIELLSALQTEAPFDLVITDVRMPGKSGLDAVTEARHAGLAVGVIFLTGYTGDVTTDEVERLGNVVLLTKPVDSHDLVAAASEIIARSNRERPPG